MCIKEEDIPRLRAWEESHNVPIYSVQVFYDRGYFIRFRDALAALKSKAIGFEKQRYSSLEGTASSQKQVIKVPYILCKEFGTVSGQTLLPKTFIDKNGKVMTYVTFSGGEIQLSSAVFQEWSPSHG